MSAQRTALILHLARDHDGLITTADLEHHGINRHHVRVLLEAGVVARCGDGLLRVAAAPPTWRQRLRIAVLCGSNGALASHRAAAALAGVEGIGSVPVEITAHRRSRHHPPSVVVHRSTDLAPHHRTRCDGIPVTTPERTIVDLAAVLDPVRLEIALDQVLHRGLTTEQRVGAVLEEVGRRGREGTAALRHLLDRRDGVRGVSATVFETRLLAAIRRHGLPEPERQYVLLDHQGTFVARFDAAYPEALIGIEADSERFHHDRQRFVADRERRNRAEALGWQVPCFTWHHVTRQPDHVGHTLEGMLRSAGWSWNSRRLVR